MANKITFITENNQTKATFDYDNLPDIQANAIKKVLGITPSGTINITENGDHDVTNYATASVEVEGGPQPTLFAPTVTGGVNTVSWINNTSNGAFGTVVGTIDGQTVTSPLTITQEMDGKTLTLVASETNFESATTTIVLEYISASSSVIAIGENTNKPLIVSVSSGNMYFKKTGAAANTATTNLFSWDAQSGTEVYTDTLEITAIYQQWISFYGQKGASDSVRAFAPKTVSATSGYPIINGTLTINNLTNGETYVGEFNRNYITSNNLNTANYHVGDKISIQVNFS